MRTMEDVLVAELGEAVLEVPDPLRTVLFVQGLADHPMLTSAWLGPDELPDGHWTGSLLWQAHEALDPESAVHACLQEVLHTPPASGRQLLTSLAFAQEDQDRTGLLDEAIDRHVLTWRVRVPYVDRRPYSDARRAEERAERRRLLDQRVDQQPAPFADTSAAGMLEPRVALGEFEALRRVWPFVRTQDLAGLAAAFPTSSARFLARSARSAVMTWHVSGMTVEQLHEAFGLEPDPGHPCAVDFDLDLSTHDLGGFLDWHARAERPGQQQLAVEWGRHRTWLLSSQDEDLSIDAELGLHNLRLALQDPGCVKGDYVDELLEAEDPTCGTPGCLTCPPATPGQSPASRLQRRAALYAPVLDKLGRGDRRH